MRFAIALLLSLSSIANAAVMHYTLFDAKLEDGTLIAGSFDFDARAGEFYPFYNQFSGVALDWTFVTSDGFIYTPANSMVIPSPFLRFAGLTVPREIRMSLIHSLQYAPGQVLDKDVSGSRHDLRTVANDSAMYASYETDGTTEQPFLSGYLLASGQGSSAIPEPATWLMLSVSLLWLVRRTNRGSSCG